MVENVKEIAEGEVPAPHPIEHELGVMSRQDTQRTG
jgi:hypothetical protein